MSSSQIVIAGKKICEPINVLINYCRDHHKTIKEFDQYACTSNESKITEVLVNQTKILNSRIGNRIGNPGRGEIENFVNKPIDWSAINPNVSLIEADPLEDGGLYDHAAKIYQTFYSFNIKDGKISKVLYLYRPNFFPILDSRVKKNYRRVATIEANRLSALNPKFADCKRSYWSAIRNDLITNQIALRDLKETIRGLNQSNCELETELIAVLAKLSDVRLLDILTWV